MSPKKLFLYLLICAIGSIGFIVILFVFTHKELQRDMSFKRGFLYNAPEKVHELDLGYNGYNIAGVANGEIYLSTARSPLNVTVLDTTLQDKKNVHLTMDQDSLPLRAPEFKLIPPYFFLTDGTIPYVLRGTIKDWHANTMLKEPLFFTNAVPIDSTSLAIRSVSSKTNEFALGTIHLSDSSKMSLSHELLKKQVDGIFDSDGTLHYNSQLRHLIYTYRYRNQYIVANDSLQLQFLGKTIDTISQAQIKVGTIASKNEQKLSAPALAVNKYSTSYGNYLFVNSLLLGRKESLVLWEKSSVIDVYNMSKNSYEFSFYVEDIEKSKLRTFYVIQDKFIGLIGNYIVIYQLDHRFKEIDPKTMMEQTLGNQLIVL